MTVIILSILLLETLELFIILFIGITIGFLFFSFVTSYTPHLPENVINIITTYLSVILFGAIFAHKKNMIQSEKLRTINTVAESIAHELRTPLRTINAGAEGLKLYIPKLIDSYAIAKQAKLDIPFIDGSHYSSLTRTLNNIISETQSSFTFIDMLLVNANESWKDSNFLPCSILECIHQAIDRYPFGSQSKDLILIENTPDFIFIGNKQIMIHVIFNLIKNALYSIKAANKGSITIRTELTSSHNYLFFKDTGLGIDNKILPSVFERFFSRTNHGTGIGLAFCKLVMENIGGNISVRSENDVYAEFILDFPVTHRIEKGEKR